jgi:hypothetical protein
VPYARCVVGNHVHPAVGLIFETLPPPSVPPNLTFPFVVFSMLTRFASPMMIPMRDGSAVGLIGQTPSHATCARPSGNSKMRASASKAPSSGAASSSRSSSHQTRSKSRLRLGRCESVLPFPTPTTLLCRTDVHAQLEDWCFFFSSLSFSAFFDVMLRWTVFLRVLMWMAGQSSTCAPDAKIRRLPHVSYGISYIFCMSLRLLPLI